jgi:glutathione reductase (NADPH)
VFGAHYAEEFKDSRGFGWRPSDAGSPAHDWTALIAAKDAEIQRLSGVDNRILANAGVTVRPGSPAQAQGPVLPWPVLSRHAVR